MTEFLHTATVTFVDASALIATVCAIIVAYTVVCLRKTWKTKKPIFDAVCITLCILALIVGAAALIVDVTHDTTGEFANTSSDVTDQDTVNQGATESVTTVPTTAEPSTTGPTTTASIATGQE